MYLDPYDTDRITDMVFETNLSTREMAQDLGMKEEEVKKAIRDLGLSWVRRKKGHVSRGQAALTQIMQKLLPGEKIESEYPVGERLRLDVYCPAHKLAAEYHGRQHFFHVPHFHGDKQGFYDSQARDERKIELCEQLGITLVIFRYTDVMTEDVVYDRLIDALRNTEFSEEPEDVLDGIYKNNPYYESQKQRRREYQRQQYRKMKSLRKGRAF